MSHLQTASSKPPGANPSSSSATGVHSLSSLPECDGPHTIEPQQLCAEIAVGLADLDRAACIEYTTDQLPALAGRIKAAGRERLAQK